MKPRNNRKIGSKILGTDCTKTLNWRDKTLSKNLIKYKN